MFKMRESVSVACLFILRDMPQNHETLKYLTSFQKASRSRSSTGWILALIGSHVYFQPISWKSIMEKIPSSCKHFYLDLNCWYAAILRYTLCPAHISTLVLTFKLFLNFAQSLEGTTFNLVSYKRQDSSTKYGLTYW